MAKAALAMMTRSLALELGPDVRVNAVAPGAILWPEDRGDTAAQQAMLARTPLGRTGTPEEVAEAVRWLGRRDEAWKGAFISQWPVRAGIRESRRWIGEYVLTGEDLLNGKRFEDEVALATWPMEFRESAKGPRLHFPRENRPAGIPLRCLKPKGSERLFVAGRCISADHEAHARSRNMPACMATGQAAGVAAAIAVEQGVSVRRVPLDKVQAALRELRMPLHAEEVHAS